MRLPASSRSTGRRQVGSHERFSGAGSRVHAQTGDGWLTRCFLVESRFLFWATAVHCANDAVTIMAYVGCCVGSGTGRGRGLLRANNKPSTPRYSPLGKPAHPIDRPTGTTKQLFLFGGAFFFAYLRLAPFEPQQSAEQHQKWAPIFVLFDATTIVYYNNPLNYVLQCLLFC